MSVIGYLQVILYSAAVSNFIPLKSTVPGTAALAAGRDNFGSGRTVCVKTYIAQG